MTSSFDPALVRQHWDGSLLKFFGSKDVTSVAASARSHFSYLVVPCLVDAFLVGYGERVRPILMRQLAGMVSLPEPNRHDFSASAHGEAIWCLRLFEWRLALALCKWLAGEPAEVELAAALAADRQGALAMSASEGAKVAAPCGESISVRLAAALAANMPRVGLDILHESDRSRTDDALRPILEFAAWAFHLLASGGQRDGSFVVRGKRALTSTLLPVLLPDSRQIESAFWIKAIFFDSGVARSAEEAMMLAYDCMPGVHRPSFGVLS